MMSIERIIGMAFSGLAVRLYAGIGATWIASEAANILVPSLHKVSQALV